MKKNPFLSIQGCVSDLYLRYKKHKRLIIAFDFDFTVYSPKEEYDCSDTINVLKRCQKQNFILIIYTAAEPERWPFMIEYCKNKGIEVFAINKNINNLSFGNWGKIYYNILLDDRAGLGQSISVLNALLDKIEVKKFYQESQRNSIV